MSQAAVTVDDVHKKFRLYHEVNRSVKIALLRGGRASYEEFEALKGVSFEVPQGATFALIGGNGSGKSTLLKCLAKILRPDSGTITARGSIAALLELGSGFHPELSGRDNVYLNGSILGLSRKEIDARFDEIVEFSGLEQFIDSPVKNYSSGMYVRLGFSVAIHIDPEILLVDEVLAVGDESFQRKSKAKFTEMRRSGKTIILVSHAMGQVQELCDYAAWLDYGVLRTVGATDGVVEAYMASQAPATDEVANPLRIDGVEVRDAGGQPTDTVTGGAPFSVRAALVATTDVAPTDLSLDIATRDGVVLSRVTHRAPRLADRTTVTIAFDSLPLASGEYQVTLVARTHGADHALESRPVAVPLVVSRGGEQPPGSHGPVPLRSRLLGEPGSD